MREIARRLVGGVWRTVDVDETNGGGGGGVVPFVGPNPPASPTDGMLWWDTDDTTAVGGSSPETKVVSPISSAQILALNSSPVQIVAAPGSGKMIAPTYAAVVFYAGETPYTGGGELRFGPTGMNVAQCLRLPGSEGLVRGDAGGDGFNADAASVGYGSLAEFDDSPLFFGCASADFADGDGRLTVTVLYTVEDI